MASFTASEKELPSFPASAEIHHGVDLHGHVVLRDHGLGREILHLKNILPPQDIQTAMEKQMKAEREKRQTLLEAEAHREASIKRAEGVTLRSSYHINLRLWAAQHSQAVYH